MASVQFDSEGPEIPKFYSGRDIFITGGTGFMGKVLIERLLATCPGIGRIHLLMRPKRSSYPEERLLQLKQCQVFDVVRRECPWQLDKLCVIAGDVTVPGLGLSPGSLTLLKKVSIIFHSAACVKLHEPLKVAVDNNLRPVMELLKICDSLPSLEAFVYVSTAYCNAELKKIEEKVYPAPVPLHELFNLVENTPEIELQKMTKKYVHPKQNTYIFTKAMSEHVVEEHSKKKIKYSIAIFRPTIVVASLEHPFPGWNDNLNGCTGVIVGVGKGLLRSTRTTLKMRLDELPVDIAIDTLIAVGWETAVERPNPMRVYNCSTVENPTTSGDFKKYFMNSLHTYPLGRPLWFPSYFTITNRYLQKLVETCLQTLPLYTAGSIVGMIGIKTPINLKLVSRQLVTMTDAIAFMMITEWNFETNNVKRLIAKLSAADASLYNLDVKTINWEKFHCDFVSGIRRYVLKRSDSDLCADRKYLQKLRALHYSVLMTLATLVTCFFTKRYKLKSLSYTTIKYIFSKLNAL